MEEVSNTDRSSRELYRLSRIRVVARLRPVPLIRHKAVGGERQGDPGHLSLGSPPREQSLTPPPPSTSVESAHHPGQKISRFIRPECTSNSLAMYRSQRAVRDRS